LIIDLDKMSSKLWLFAADDQTARNLNKKSRKLDSWTPVRNGVWETRIPFTANRDASERLFDAMTLLEFDVYL
jgi:hypothetical protein